MFRYIVEIKGFHFKNQQKMLKINFQLKIKVGSAFLRNNFTTLKQCKELWGGCQWGKMETPNTYLVMI